MPRIHFIKAPWCILLLICLLQKHHQMCWFFDSSFSITFFSVALSARFKILAKAPTPPAFEKSCTITDENFDSTIFSISENWIKQYIKRIIYHDQAGFIPGMQISFNIWKQINVIHHINSMKKKKYSIWLY